MCIRDRLHGCHYKGRTINSVLVEGELINGEIRFISSFFVSQEYILTETGGRSYSDFTSRIKMDLIHIFPGPFVKASHFAL